MSRIYEDFTGKIINGIKIIAVVPDSGGKGKHKKWICECPACKKQYIKQSNHIKDSATSLCFSCAKEKIEDLSNKKFNHLFVNFMLPKEKDKRTFCSCTCDCGTTNVIVQANHLKAGEIKSCGCLVSNGEEEIAKILKDNNINFIRQKTFPDLQYKSLLRFDFYLPEINFIIEYNGIQHYQPVKFFGGEESFNETKIRDELKRQYCLQNNINYLVIKFNENILNSLIKNNIIKKR